MNRRGLLGSLMGVAAGLPFARRTAEASSPQPIDPEMEVGASGTVQVSDGETRRDRHLGFWDIAWSGAIPYADHTPYEEMTDSAGAIRDAIETARLLGVVVVGKGQYRVDSLVTIGGDTDFTGATFVSHNPALAPVVRIGSAIGNERLINAMVIAPKVRNAGKESAPGWQGGTVGIEISNVYSSKVWIPQIRGYATGLLMTAVGTGVSTTRSTLATWTTTRSICTCGRTGRDG